MRAIWVLILALSGLAAAADVTNFTAVVAVQRESEQYFFAREESSGLYWRVSMDERPYRRFRPGDVVRVRGELEPRHRHTRRLFFCDVEAVGRAEAPAPRKTSIAALASSIDGKTEIPSPDWYGDYVSVTGRVADVFRNDVRVSILVRDGDASVLFSVVHPMPAPLPEKLETGAVLRIDAAAVYTVQWEGEKIKAFNTIGLIPDSFDAVEVVESGPVWNEKMLWRFSVALVALVALALSWVWIIHRERKRDLRIADAVRRERLRLSYDLHDDFQQLLASAVFQLAALRNKTLKGAPPDTLKPLFDGVGGALDAAQAALRAALWSINEEAEGPSRLSELLVYAAGRLAHWGNAVEFAFSGRESPISRRLAGSLLMVLQEAVGNALRHGGADSIKVNVVFSAGAVEIGIADNGCGFAPAAALANPGAHIGLAGMKSRVEAHGGTFSIESRKGRGTTINIKIPL